MSRLPGQGCFVFLKSFSKSICLCSESFHLEFLFRDFVTNGI